MKTYQCGISACRLLNIKVIMGEKEIYSGKVDEAPEEIKMYLLN